jgi:hypothetical protein
MECPNKHFQLVHGAYIGISQKIELWFSSAVFLSAEVKLKLKLVC